MKNLKVILTGLFLGTSLFAGTYNVDKSHSSVGFKVKHMMVTNVNGTFDDFSGSFEYDEETKTLKGLEGTILTSSINTANTKRDGHLKAPDMFDAVKYPQITFKVTNIKEDKVMGDLTIKGITKKVTLDLELAGTTIKDPWGNTRTGLSLNGKINRYDFDIKWNKVLEAGGIAVGETVKLNIELEGILKK